MFDRVLATLGGNPGTENVPRDVLVEAFKRSREEEEPAVRAGALKGKSRGAASTGPARDVAAALCWARRTRRPDPRAVKKPKEATETREELAKAAAV